MFFLELRLELWTGGKQDVYNGITNIRVIEHSLNHYHIIILAHNHPQPPATATAAAASFLLTHSRILAFVSTYFRTRQSPDFPLL